MSEKFLKEAQVSVGPDSSTRVFTLPAVDGLSTTYFVSLTLESAGQIKSRNFYWLSTREETLDWARQELDTSGEYDISTWTPSKTFADYTPLNQLASVDLEATAQYQKSGEENITTVTLRNPTATLAFAVHLKVNRGSDPRVSREGRPDDEILPVLWQDNYFALLPGETRQVTATFAGQKAGKSAPAVEIGGWNVKEKMIGVQPQ